MYAYDMNKKEFCKFWVIQIAYVLLTLDIKNCQKMNFYVFPHYLQIFHNLHF